MILRPIHADTDVPAAAGPAWPAIAARQRQHAEAYLLISQPDHARLSGELAAHFVSPRFTRVTPEVARAIASHDEGWGIYPSEASASAPPELSAEGRPVSFIEFAPPQFLCAWTRSIEAAGRICAAGGIIVSRHFCSLAEFRLKQGALAANELRMISDYLARERERQQHWLGGCGYEEPELAALLEVLQFCDLMSLYLCCGTRQTVEFPNCLTDAPLRVVPTGSANSYQLCPSPFQAPGQPERAITLSVTARRYPSQPAASTTTLEFALL